MAVSVVEEAHGPVLASGNPRTIDVSAWSTPQTDDRVVVVFKSFGSRQVTGVSGLGATWASGYLPGNAGSLWVGTGATSAGTITVTMNSTDIVQLDAYLVRGLATGTLTVTGTSLSNAGDTEFGPTAILAGNGQIAITWMRGVDATLGAITFPVTETPSGDWNYSTQINNATTSCRVGYRIPTSTQTNHQVTAQGATGDAKQVWLAVLGTYSAPATTPSGDGSGSFAWAGSAVGSTDKSGTASGAFSWAGVASGSTVKSGSATGVFSWAGAATGSAPAVGGASGSAAGAFAWAGAAVGSTVKSGTAAGAYQWTGAATGTGEAATTVLDFRHARRLDWAENGTQVDLPDDVTLLRFPSSRGLRFRGILTPDAPPLGVLTEWPIQRQAHLMPALSAATPRYRAGNPANPGEYEVDYGTVGRPHVFIGGVDHTYLRSVPVDFEDHSSSVPFNSESATVRMPQLTPWDVPGAGDLSALTADADVEIVMVRPDDTLDHLWEGFFQVDEDSSGEGREDYTFRAQGLFAQAAHEPWDPPVVLEPTDIGTLIADALNGVTHRRWLKIPRVRTGIMSRSRGTQGQSVWQYVQDLLSTAWTDDGRQWTIARVGPYVYRIQLKASTSAAQWTVTKGAPGVSVNLSVDQSTRRDAIYGRGFAPDGGYWCGRVFPGLEFGVPPRYPFNNTSTNIGVGTTDGMTDTRNGVTTWQRAMRALGYPIRVDGVMNSADTKWVLKIQRDRGLTVDGSLGPQTWAATWENNNTEADLTSYRLPLATLAAVEPFLYSATGARIGANPADDPSIIRHAMPEVDFGSGVKKSEAIVMARKMLAREQTPGLSGSVRLLTDPHEAGSSRFDIRPGDNVKVVGHRGTDVVLQVAEVSVQGLTVSLTVDSKARDALSVLAILERDRDALRDPSARSGRGTDGSALNKASVVQYESESKAGTVPRTAVNGDSGLWTIRKTFVSQVGVAKVVFTATQPKAELYVALFNRPIRTSVLASLVPNPGASSDGWYDNVDTLREKYGLMEVFGSPGNPGGYFPRQKGDGPLTGRLEDSASTLYDSPYGGFVWVAMFTSRSTWVEGRVFPAVPT